ncbi:MAG: colanic acid biosynthesis glycosyl transferase WcaI [Actinomycetota bacterium]|nr:colanic acid biosynthesis glycosyl transferase WcaI [Actinomycetota bacterium]
MKIVVVPPHFEPDVAPTGVVFTRVVEELARRGHEIDVVTSLPWYRNHKVEDGYEGHLVRHEDTPWGRITRIHPFPTADKMNIPRRALSFAGFSALAAGVGMRGGRADAVIGVSPPLTLGLTGWAIARARGARFVFNLQDIFPDVAIELGALRSGRVIAVTRRLESLCYRLSDAITVLSDDLKQNLVTKGVDPAKVHVIPNFVDTEEISPRERDNSYREEYGLTGKTVVMYAGNIGLSQAFDSVLDAASALAYEEDLVFVINGQGAQRAALENKARGMANVKFVDMQPANRLPEVLAAGDIHLIPLKKGLANSSVPSKTYSILAAGRPFVASVDEGTEIARVAERSGGGIAVAPEDSEALAKALRRLLDQPDETRRMGEEGRAYVEGWASPAAVAESYSRLLEDLQRR